MAVFAATRPGFAAEPLVRLVSGLPWAGVSNIIGYDGRVWFVNSVKWVNHNSADVYAYDPADGTARFERHLFSQDAGDAVVHDGLLYFPFEDPRFSPGIGEFAVTDGASWRWGMIAGERAFHVHAMEGHKGALFAATSAWQARLMRSDDRGTHWRLAHLRAAPPQTVSRIVALASLDGTLYAGLTARWDGAGGKLLAWDGRVPPELLLGPWTQPANRPEKYLTPVEAAAWAVAELGQSDAATIDALIARLGRAGDPDWLAGDLAGSLSVLTGERHGYDVDAWKRWWRVERCRIDGAARPAAC